jgi:hypothetical protein
MAPVFVQAQLRHLRDVGEMPLHPRILLLQGEEQQIKLKIEDDPTWAKMHQVIVSECDRIIALPEVVRQLEGRRLLGVSREALRRIFYLSYVYRMSNDEKYFLKAEKEMLAISAFSDWNPSHFLDVAEMTMAVAIGYDWLHAKLSVSSREIIKKAILSKGIDPSFSDQYNGWLRATHNWNQVCNAGMTYGALAIYEDMPELSKMIIDRAVESIKLPMGDYAPDGAYPEGYGYWGYGTSFNVMFLSAIEKVLKTDYGLSALPGFMNTAGYLANMTGPLKMSFNYADNGVGGGLNPTMFWFASKAGNTSLLWEERGYLESDRNRGRDRLLPAIMIWGGDIRVTAIESPKELFWIGQGAMPVALMRTSWTDPKAIYVGFKAGSPSVNHAHMDVGSFIMDADGVRWAMDFGPQDYNSLEQRGVDLWNMQQNSQRWEVFRYNIYVHNTLTVNGKLHLVNGKANIDSYSSTPNFLHGVSDISSMFEGQLAGCVRGVAIVEKKYVVVRDEVKTSGKEATIEWRLLTSSEAKITGRNSIELRQDGKRLKIEVAEPARVTMKTWSTTPTHDYDTPNPGTVLVGFEVTIPANTNTTLLVKLIPQSAGNTSAKIPELKNWPK